MYPQILGKPSVAGFCCSNSFWISPVIIEKSIHVSNLLLIFDIFAYIVLKGQALQNGKSALVDRL